MSGGKPRPRKLSVLSAMMAAATSMVAATITGPRLLGRMCRTTWRVVLAPSARAASTNSFSRRLKNCARTSRATGIQRKPPITATMRMKMPTSSPKAAFSGSRNRKINSSSSGSCGRLRNRSVSHISNESTQPRAMPAMAPMITPTVMAISIAARPTARLMRPPYSMRASRSRPRSSVPNRWPPPGGARRALKSTSLMPTL